MPDNTYDEVLQEFLNAGASMRCSKVKRLLQQLGFEVVDKSKGGHKVFGHRGISTFRTGDYNCGHKSDSEVKRIYIKQIIKILRLYESEIKTFLKI